LQESPPQIPCLPGSQAPPGNPYCPDSDRTMLDLVKWVGAGITRSLNASLSEAEPPEQRSQAEPENEDRKGTLTS